MSWGEEYPYAFPRWLGPVLPSLVIHHPEYAKSIFGQTGKCLHLVWGSHVPDTSLRRESWETCLESSPLPAFFTAIAIPPLLPFEDSQPAPGFTEQFLFSCKTVTMCLFLPVHCLHYQWSCCLLWHLPPPPSVFASKPSDVGELAWQWVSEDISSLLLCSFLWSVMPVSGTYMGISVTSTR